MPGSMEMLDPLCYFFSNMFVWLWGGWVCRIWQNFYISNNLQLFLYFRKKALALHKEWTPGSSGHHDWASIDTHSAQWQGGQIHYYSLKMIWEYCVQLFHRHIMSLIDMWSLYCHAILCSHSLRDTGGAMVQLVIQHDGCHNQLQPNITKHLFLKLKL